LNNKNKIVGPDVMSQIGSPTGGPTQSADAQQNMAVNDAVVVVALVKSAFSPAELG
jgi:hypothetical protein